ncbi:hypothetical protein GZ78_11240 [Endozoicomonas numazuensis]|uniref:Lipoprotein n=1 Tax=Endozoicomonas numazuensis TaxID=1137799 RepID=A0A081NI56_9GAMM|nr:hypothetical protein GZ78_11240 [Endozoicomonas numazuensis]
MKYVLRLFSTFFLSLLISGCSGGGGGSNDGATDNGGGLQKIQVLLLLKTLRIFKRFIPMEEPLLP